MADDEDLSVGRGEMRANDPVWIVEYDTRWPGMFRALARAAREALGPAATRIDHVGSTAVPGLAAKPVVDIQISVPDLAPLDAYRLPLESLGYVWRGDNDDLTKRYFREAPGTRRTHLHVRRAASSGESTDDRHRPRAGSVLDDRARAPHERGRPVGRDPPRGGSSPPGTPAGHHSQHRGGQLGVPPVVRGPQSPCALAATARTRRKPCW